MTANEATAAALIGARLRNPDGRVIGRLSALIHRSIGVDLLITSRLWPRTKTVRGAAAGVSIDMNGCLELLAATGGRDRDGGRTT